MIAFLPTIVTLAADAEPACSGLWSLFDSTEPEDHAAAKRLCAGCPVRSTCSEIALSQRDSPTGRLAIEGTWAGELHGGERNAYRRAQNVSKVAKKSGNLAPCGTRAAYERHRRAGEQACDDCLAAKTESNRVERDKKRGAAA